MVPVLPESFAIRLPCSRVFSHQIEVSLRIRGIPNSKGREINHSSQFSQKIQLFLVLSFGVNRPTMASREMAPHFIDDRYRDLVEEGLPTFTDDLLHYEEAVQLFSQNAFKQNIPMDEFNELTFRMVDCAGGHPLALEVLGRFLFSRTLCEWKSTLHKLTRVPNGHIFGALRVSFDALDWSDRHLFLDVACFLKGEDTNIVESILDSSDYFPVIGLKVLFERGLISISDNKVSMHPLILQMGQEIVRRECSIEPGKRSRLWDPIDIHRVLTRNTGTKAIEGIQLDMSKSEEIHVESQALARMHNLRYLKFHMGSEGPTFDNCKVHLPPNFEFPCHELRYLHWDGYPLESLPTHFPSENLVELHMCYGSIKELWKVPKHLGRLRTINLSHSQHLLACPDLSAARNLERVILDGCTSLLEVHPSIVKLQKLTVLNLENCKMLHHFPKSIQLKSLLVLNLSGCSKLDKFPEIQGNMEYLLELNLKSTAIVELPYSIGCLSRLVSLDMQNCKNLKILPSNICALKSLEILLLSGCSRLEVFPEIIEIMENLKILRLDGTSIEVLPSSIAHLKGLVLLNLRKCKNIRDLPSSICDLRSLQTLIVSGCSKLNKLPEDLGSLQCLVNLHADATAITRLPRSFIRLRNLKVLSFSGCGGSTARFWDSPLSFRLWQRENSGSFGSQLAALSGLNSLKKLDLSGCNLVEETVSNSVFCLCSLVVLNLSRNNFVKIPTGISELCNLSVLLVGQCKSLEEIPMLPPSIKLLDACNCTSLKLVSVPSPIRPLQMTQQHSSSSWFRPVMFKLHNCSKLDQNDVAAILEKLHLNFFPGAGYSIVLPGSTIPKWSWHQNRGSSVTVALPPNWLDNFLGFALYAVFALEEDEFIQGPGPICCSFEFREGPYFSSSILWSHNGGRVVETDHIWLIYQPGDQFVKLKSRYANRFGHVRAVFSLFGASHVVKKCGIRPLYGKDNVVRSCL